MKNRVLLFLTIFVSSMSIALDSVLDTNYSDQQENEEPQQNEQKTIRDEAFKQMLNRALPMRPDQIIQLHKALDKSKKAVATPVNPIPTPVSSTLTVDLAPGSASPVIRLATGFVSSIVFLDSTGQPWQIADYSLGNPKDFNIQWDQKTNTMFMQSTKDYVHGNLAIRLAKLDTPIMLSLVTAQKEVDFRVDLHIKARGPKAIAPIVADSVPDSAKQSLLGALDGIPPEGSEVIEVIGDNGQAWLVNDKLFYRTRLNLLSPAWSAKISSADGMHVFELNKTPVALASRNGKPVEIAFKGI